MTNFESLDTYFITSTAAEYDSGHVVWDSEIDLDVLDHFISLRCPFPANTCGLTEVWTTNPSFKAKYAENVEINYVSPEELTAEGCKSLYDYVFGDWVGYKMRTANGVYFSDGDITQATEALERFIEQKLPDEVVSNYLQVFS